MHFSLSEKKENLRDPRDLREKKTFQLINHNFSILIPMILPADANEIQTLCYLQIVILTECARVFTCKSINHLTG